MHCDANWLKDLPTDHTEHRVQNIAFCVPTLLTLCVLCMLGPSSRVMSCAQPSSSIVLLILRRLLMAMAHAWLLASLVACVSWPFSSRNLRFLENASSRTTNGTFLYGVAGDGVLLNSLRPLPRMVLAPGAGPDWIANSGSA